MKNKKRLSVNFYNCYEIGNKPISIFPYLGYVTPSSFAYTRIEFSWIGFEIHISFNKN